MRKRLDDLLKDVPVLERHHWDPKKIFNKITSDSRAVGIGDIFVACPGTRMDGHDVLGQAIHDKAAVVVFEKEPEVPTVIILHTGWVNSQQQLIHPLL